MRAPNIASACCLERGVFPLMAVRMSPDLRPARSAYEFGMTRSTNTVLFRSPTPKSIIGTTRPATVKLSKVMGDSPRTPRRNQSSGPDCSALRTGSRNLCDSSLVLSRVTFSKSGVAVAC